ncbi:MAG: TonB-dependent receptor, partial [Pseudomonadota bacterium]
MKKFKWLHGASAIAVVTSFLATDAMAQSLVDEITVTATKREENIQDVPIAVSAYSGALLEASGANDIRELTSVSPSLTVAATQSEATGVNARIRGVGTVGDNPGLQSAVGVFIDEVYRSRNSVALGDLGEIEGVEIARGPQGTLFGRNSSAGAIIVRTKQPEFENSGYIEGTYGSFDNVRVSGGLTGPLVENLLAGRVNVSWEQRDGYIEDLNGGDDLNDRDRVQARGQLLFEPSDEVSVRFIADYAKREENCCGAVSIVNGPLQGLANALGGGAEVDPPNPSALVASVTPGRGYQQDVDEWGVSTQVNWALPFGDLVSITAYRDWEVVRSQDVDYSTADIAFRPEDGFTNGFETFTQELRLSGETGPLEWIFGGFYSKEDVTLNDQLSVGAQYEAFFDTLASGLAGAAVDISAITSLPDGAVFGPGGIASQNDNHNVESTSWAIFTSQTLNVTDRLAVTAGVRYTEEDIDYSSVLSST